MEDERRQQDGRDDASVSAGEASDVTLAREENSAAMTLLQALMTEIKGLTEKIDQQAAQIRELVAGFSQVREVVAAQEHPEL